MHLCRNLLAASAAAVFLLGVSQALPVHLSYRRDLIARPASDTADLEIFQRGDFGHDAFHRDMGKSLAKRNTGLLSSRTDKKQQSSGHDSGPGIDTCSLCGMKGGLTNRITRPGICPKDRSHVACNECFAEYLEKWNNRHIAPKPTRCFAKGCDGLLSRQKPPYDYQDVFDLPTLDYDGKYDNGASEEAGQAGPSNGNRTPSPAPAHSTAARNGERKKGKKKGKENGDTSCCVS